MASLAKGLSDLKKKFNAAIDQSLTKLTEDEVTRLEREVVAALRNLRLGFWSRFSRELTRNRAVASDKDSTTTGATVTFGEGAYSEKVAWKPLSQTYLDWKQKHGLKSDRFFELTGKLKAALQSYSAEDGGNVKSASDKFTRVFGPPKVIVGNIRNQKDSKGQTTLRGVRVRVIPFSKYPTIPPDSKEFENLIFQIGPGGYNSKFRASLTNGNRTPRKALVPYTRWWLKSSSERAVQQALEKMRKKT